VSRGVVANLERRFAPLTDGIHVEALVNFVDCTIECAARLFDKIAQAISLPSAQTLEQWLDRTG
jgi:hypothetical protein